MTLTAHSFQALRVAVVGDPHFFVESSAEGTSISHIRLLADGKFKETRPTENPWVDLQALICKESLSADLLLCVGDITTHANATALKSAWSELLDLGNQLGVQHVASATGNHDVASRGNIKEVAANPIRWLSEIKGAIEELKLLEPPYPVVERSDGTIIPNRHCRTRYFGDAIVLVETEKYRLLVLNTCCEHSLEPHQYERGTFPQSTQNALREVLRESGHDEKLNLLVCHHPPIPHSEQGLGGHDQIENGEALIRCLEEHGAWMIIHGHKHHGRIANAQGSSSPTVVFAAASLGAYLQVNEPGMKNQFYVLDLTLEEGRIAGIVRAWNWHRGLSWQRAQPDKRGIFDGCGLGLHVSVDKVAASIVALGNFPMAWSTVVESVPALRFASPTDMNILERRLEHRHKLIIECDEFGYWRELVKSRI